MEILAEGEILRGEHMKLNHIGIVVYEIAVFANLFKMLGFKDVTDPEPDPIQKVRACFVTIDNIFPIHIELLEPIQEDSPISNFLKKRGGGLHHLCFEVNDIDKVVEDLNRNGFKIISPPVECIGYDKSFRLNNAQPTKIAFFLLSDKFLLELLQNGSP